MSALRSRSIFLMGQSSHWGRRASASSRQVAAAPPASHTASMVMGRSSPMVCCASSVLRPAHTVWRVVRSVAIEKIMLGRVGGLGGGAAQSRSLMFHTVVGAGTYSPDRIAWRRFSSACRRAAYAFIASCMMGQASAVALVMNMVSVRLMCLVYRVRASGRRQGGHCCRCHSGRRWQR